MESSNLTARWRSVMAILTVIAWIVVTGFGVLGFQTLSQSINTTGLNTPGSESAAFQQTLQRDYPKASALGFDVLVHHHNSPVTRSAINGLTEAIRHQFSQLMNMGVQNHGNWTVSAWSEKTHHFVTALKTYSSISTSLHKIVAHFASVTHSQVFITGTVPMQSAFSQLALQDLIRAARFTLPLTLILLLLVFRSLYKSFAVIFSATTGALVGLAGLTLWPGTVPITSFTEQAGLMIGLSVGIDYGMMWLASLARQSQSEPVANRFRQARKRAVRMILPAAAIVILALLTLMEFHQPLITSIALGIVFSVAGSALASLSILPAILWLGRSRLRTATADRSTKVLTTVQTFLLRRQRTVGVALVAVLIGIGSLVPAITLWEPGISTLPKNLPAVQGFRSLQRHFPSYAGAPIQIALFPPTGGWGGQILAFKHTVQWITNMPAVQRIQDPLPLNELLGKSRTEQNAWIRHILGSSTHPVILNLWSIDANSSPHNLNLVHQLRSRIRATPTPFRMQIGGGAAQAHDAVRRISTSFLGVLAAVAMITMIGLLWRFRSAVIAISSIVLNGLSTLVSLGVLVALFQFQWGRWIGLHTAGALQWTTPVLIFAILFAVGTDYEIFYVEAIQHHQQQEKPMKTAILLATRETGTLLSGAAIIMASVFMAFGLSGLEFMQELGIGLAIAVLIDATIMRMMLVPSLLMLFQDRTWWPGRRSHTYREVIK